jgi:parallel beta-helix repeat protein
MKIFSVKRLVLISSIYFIISATTNAVEVENCTLAPILSPIFINAKDTGAKGDGITDDTLAIQSAINQVVGTGGTVLIPSGIYMIDAITSIKIKSDMTLRMSNGTILKALPNDKSNYNIINITDASNINIIDGTLMGERTIHTGTSGEWGMGITLRGATNIVVQGVTAKNFWGDGFYISGASKNIKFCSVIAENNRRQGMSIISVDGMVVKNSVFKNTNGTAPQAGIDLEPNDEDTIKNVQIVSSQFIGNKGPGVLFAQVSNHSLIENVILDGNTIINNIAGIGIVNTTGHSIINNKLIDNHDYGIRLYQGAKGNIIRGNKIFGKNGIKDEVGDNTVIGNVID